MIKKYLWLAAALVTVFALVFAACSSDSDSDPEKYTVTFDLLGIGGGNITKTVESGAKVTPPADDPEAEDYEFVGWYADQGLTEEFDFDTPITKKTTIFAKWAYMGTDGVTVSFDTAGGSVIADITIPSGQLVTKPADPVKEDFIFKAWYISTEFNEEDLFDFDTPITENITLYAAWDASLITYKGFNWMVIDDNKETSTGLPGGNPIGNSIINFVNVANIDGERVFAVEGLVKNGFQYGFAILSAQATEENLAALQSARKISFYIQGTAGGSVDVKLPQKDIKGPMEGGTGDSAFYYSRVSITSSPVKHTLTIPTTGSRGAGSSFSQPSDWGVKKDYDQTTLEQINFQTTIGATTAGAKFAFQIWGLELLQD